MDAQGFSEALHRVLARVPANDQPRMAGQIHAVFLEIPGDLTTGPWTVSQIVDPLWDAFAHKTYGVIDRELRTQERQVEHLPIDHDDRRRVAALRFKMLGELATDLPFTSPILVGWQTALTLLRPPGEPRAVYRASVVLIAVRVTRRGLKLLEQRSVPSRPRRMDDGPAIDWIETEEVNNEAIELFRRHLSWTTLLHLRPGQGLRNQRESAASWPLITRWLVPALFHVIESFYAARPYRAHLPASSPGISQALAADIADLVRTRVPHMARDLTEARVNACLRRHLVEDCPICTNLAGATS